MRVSGRMTRTRDGEPPSMPVVIMVAPMRANSKREKGKCKGTYRFADGNMYEWVWKEDKSEGKGL